MTFRHKILFNKSVINIGLVVSFCWNLSQQKYPPLGLFVQWLIYLDVGRFGRSAFGSLVESSRQLCLYLTKLWLVFGILYLALSEKLSVLVKKTLTFYSAIQKSSHSHILLHTHYFKLGLLNKKTEHFATELTVMGISSSASWKRLRKSCLVKISKLLQPLFLLNVDHIKQEVNNSKTQIFTVVRVTIIKEFTKVGVEAFRERKTGVQRKCWLLEYWTGPRSVRSSTTCSILPGQ